MKKTACIPDLVATAGSKLTPTERLIAEAILAEPTLPAFGTVTDLACRVGTSRPSIVRFANKLGFEGYSHLQQHARSEVSRQLTRPSDRIRRDGNTELSARTLLDDALDAVFSAVKDHRLRELVQPIIRARHVWVLSGETSRAGAYAFHSGLSMVRPNVHLLEDRSIAIDLSNATQDDTAVVFDFFRYRRVVITATETLVDAGVSVVAITDSPLSPLVELTDTWCEIQIPAIGPFDSSVPVVAIAELLVSTAAKELQEQATARIDRIESLWESTEVFV